MMFFQFQFLQSQCLHVEQTAGQCLGSALLASWGDVNLFQVIMTSKSPGRPNIMTALQRMHNIREALKPAG